MNNLFSNVDFKKLQGDVSSQTRTVIQNVFLFLNELKSDPKKLDSMNFNKPREMAALICGVSMATVDRIKTEVVQSGRPCKPRTNYKKPVSVTNIDDFDKSVLKRTIASFYDNGEYPSVDRIIEKYREVMPDFKCGNTSIRKVLKEIGYKYKKNAEGRKYLKRYRNQNTKKGDIQEWLKKKNINFDKCEIKEELLRKVKASNPQKIYVIDNLANERGHEVIRLPLYHCQYNPIERIWAQVKGEVAANNNTFKIADIEILLHKAIDNVTQEDWVKCVRHAEELQNTDLQKAIIRDQAPFIINLQDDTEDENSNEEE